MRWLVLFLVVLALGAGVWLTRAALQPIDYGVEGSVFLDPDKAAIAYVKAVPAHKGKEKLMAAILRNFTERTYKGQKVLGMMETTKLIAYTVPNNVSVGAISIRYP